MSGMRANAVGLRQAAAATVVLSVLLALSTATADAAGGPALLDPSFGQSGRAVVPAEVGRAKYWDTDVLAATAPDGKIVVGFPAFPTSEVFRFLPDGRLDTSFGEEGRIRLGSADANFGLVGLAVDPQGRVVVAAINGYESGHFGRVGRLLPNGSPDPTFGSGGMVEPDLHIPLLAQSDSSPTSVTSLTVDGQDRILIAGSASRSTGTHCPIRGSGYLAGLDSSGALDASFGNGGVVLFPTLASATGVALGPGNTPVVFGRGGCTIQPANNGPAIFGLGPTGEINSTFGDRGRVDLGETPAAVAVDGRGRVDFLRHDESIRRLKANGSLERSFGTSGTARLRAPGPRSRLTAIATAPDGGVLAAGTQVSTRRAHSGRRDGTPRLAVVALTAKGKPRPGFGHEGVVVLAAEKGVLTAGSGVLPQGDGAALVVATVRDPKLPGGHGIALFRFLLPG
jgi:uncharacterized delta-60 repeat protein